jgi:hypothetical protein
MATARCLTGGLDPIFKKELSIAVGSLKKSYKIAVPIAEVSNNPVNHGHY